MLAIVADKMMQACKNPDNWTTKKVLKMLQNGRIAGRQIKSLFDYKNRLILFTDTDEEKISPEEIIQFSDFKYDILPLINSREQKIPVMRDYHFGIRLRTVHK